jgi:hypothetical protein
MVGRYKVSGGRALLTSRVSYQAPVGAIATPDGAEVLPAGAWYC